MYSSREPFMLCCEITKTYLPYYLSICWDAVVEQMRANTHLPAANSTCYWIAADGAARRSPLAPSLSFLTRSPALQYAAYHTLSITFYRTFLHINVEHQVW